MSNHTSQTGGPLGAGASPLSFVVITNGRMRSCVVARGAFVPCGEFDDAKVPSGQPS